MKKLFEGIRVVDFGNNVAGPLTAAMLADFGAEVIKVEKPGGGDDSRGYGPFIEGQSISGFWLNRGKWSIVLDIKNKEGRNLFLALVKESDVLIESFRPGVMARLGLDYESLRTNHPRLIMCSESAFGQTGPYRDLPGYDMIAQAVSGLIDITGYPDLPPCKMGPSVADYCCAYNAFGAISAALFYRERTGDGQYIDVSLAESAFALNDHVEFGFLDKDLRRAGNHHVLLGPYGVFCGKNGSITIAALNQNLWGRLCRLMGRDEYIDHPDYDSSGKRARQPVAGNVIRMIEAWLDTFDSMEAAEQLLRDEGIPCARIVKLQDLERDPHYIDRGMIVDMKVPLRSAPRVKVRGNPIHMSETPCHIGDGPGLGEQRDMILKRVLGLGDEQIGCLEEKGAFGTNRRKSEAILENGHV